MQAGGHRMLFFSSLKQLEKICIPCNWQICVSNGFIGFRTEITLFNRQELFKTGPLPEKSSIN